MHRDSGTKTPLWHAGPLEISNIHMLSEYVLLFPAACSLNCRCWALNVLKKSRWTFLASPPVESLTSRWRKSNAFVIHYFRSHFPVPVFETEHTFLIRVSIWSFFFIFCWTAVKMLIDRNCAAFFAVFLGFDLNKPPFGFWGNYVLFTMVIQLPEATLCRTLLPFHYCPSRLKNLKLIPASVRP